MSDSSSSLPEWRRLSIERMRAAGAKTFQHPAGMGKTSAMLADVARFEGRSLVIVPAGDRREG